MKALDALKDMLADPGKNRALAIGIGIVLVGCIMLPYLAHRKGNKEKQRVAELSREATKQDRIKRHLKTVSLQMLHPTRSEVHGDPYLITDWREDPRTHVITCSWNDREAGPTHAKGIPFTERYLMQGEFSNGAGRFEKEFLGGWKFTWKSPKGKGRFEVTKEDGAFVGYTFHKEKKEEGGVIKEKEYINWELRITDAESGS